MTQELLYTSAPRGLKPGSRGFCTVVSTQGMGAPLAAQLEALSAYRPVFPPGDANAELNPVSFSHVKLSVAGRRYHVLSRVADYGLDYTQRTNKLAHHVALEPQERSAGGPAWTLQQPRFMQHEWDGEPRILPAGRKVPQGDREARVCNAWGRVTGDAGWAGVLAESFLEDPDRLVYIIFEPGMDLVPLFAEAISLLPRQRRWDATFSTYFTNLPPGVTCNWRCILAGSPEENQSRRFVRALRINLCESLGRAQGGPLVDAARTGVLPQIATAEADSEEVVELEAAEAPAATATVPTTGSAATYGLGPPPSRSSIPPVVPLKGKHPRSRRGFNRLAKAAIGVAVLVICLVTTFALWSGTGDGKKENQQVALADTANSPDDANRDEGGSTTPNPANKSETAEDQSAGDIKSQIAAEVATTGSDGKANGKPPASDPANTNDGGGTAQTGSQGQTSTVNAEGKSEKPSEKENNAKDQRVEKPQSDASPPPAKPEILIQYVSLVPLTGLDRGDKSNQFKLESKGPAAELRLEAVSPYKSQRFSLNPSKDAGVPKIEVVQHVQQVNEISNDTVAIFSLQKPEGGANSGSDVELKFAPTATSPLQQDIQDALNWTMLNVVSKDDKVVERVVLHAKIECTCTGRLDTGKTTFAPVTGPEMSKLLSFLGTVKHQLDEHLILELNVSNGNSESDEAITLVVAKANPQSPNGDRQFRAALEDAKALKSLAAEIRKNAAASVDPSVNDGAWLDALEKAIATPMSLNNDKRPTIEVTLKKNTVDVGPPAKGMQDYLGESLESNVASPLVNDARNRGNYSDFRLTLRNTGAAVKQLQERVTQLEAAKTKAGNDQKLVDDLNGQIGALKDIQTKVQALGSAWRQIEKWVDAFTKKERHISGRVYYEIPVENGERLPINVLTFSTDRRDVSAGAER